MIGNMAVSGPLAYTRGEGSPVRRARMAAVFALSLSFLTATAAPGPSPPAWGALRPVSAGGVMAFVPPGWEYRPIPGTSVLRGLQAARDLDRWSKGKGGGPGVEAYWVDATAVRVPSDYYGLAARGPVMDRLKDARCRPQTERVWSARGHRLDPAAPSDYLATASGTCRDERSRTRWSAFVAAPGFGPARKIGIARSGLYVVLVSVREGPGAGERLDRLISGVSFGGTTVPEFLEVVGGRLP